MTTRRNAMLTVQNHQFTLVEDKMRRALSELTIFVPSKANVDQAARETTDALRLTRHMRRMAQEMVVIPYYDTAAQREALDRHRRAEQARVVNPGGGCFLANPIDSCR